MLVNDPMVQQRLLIELRRRDFVAFVAKVFETVSQADALIINWHHYAIAWQLEQIEKGQNTRLLVTMPPRNLKSIAISVAWVAWLLGKRPSTRIICITYSDKLSADLADMCKTVMQSDWYRATFPGTILRGKAPVMDFKTTKGGGRYATSTGGTLTGRGGDILIVDDPIKPDDAFSPVVRQSCIDWYSNTLVSRINNKKLGAMVLVMQRLHEEDLAGHVMKEGDWRHLNLPAIATDDEDIQLGPNNFYRRKTGVSLNPRHEDIPTLLRQRRVMGSHFFSAQYQQQPIPTAGLMIKRAWLGSYLIAPTKQTGDLIVQSWDTASRVGLTNDYSACVTSLVRGRQVYILESYRGRLDFPALIAKVKQLARKWRIDALLIEEAVSGIQLIQSLKDQPEKDIPSPIARPANIHKEARAWGQTHRFEAGDVILPKQAPWLEDLILELIGFPKTRYDDQVDAMTHLLAWSTEKRPAPPTEVGPEVFYVDEWGQTVTVTGDAELDPDDPWSGL